MIFSAMALTFRGSFPEGVLVSLSLNSNNSCPVEVWQSFTSSQHISLCSLQPRNPKWIVLLNHTVFKSASAVELPKRSFSYKTSISSSLKLAEALGLLPLPFRFSSYCFDWSPFRVCSNWTSFVRQSPWFFFFKWCSKLVKNAIKELGSYSSLSSFLWTIKRNSLRNLFHSWGVNLSNCLILPFKTRNLWNRATWCLVFFLVFSFSCLSMNSSTDESRLWEWLVWFEAIFVNKNVPKLLEMCYLSVIRSGEWATRFCSLVKII